MINNFRKNISLKIVYGAFLVLVVLTFLFMIIGLMNSDVDMAFDDKSIYDWGEGWSVSVGNDAGQSMDLPVRLDVEKGKTVILKKTLPNKIKKYNSLMIESKRQDVLVNVDGVLRSSYTDQDIKTIGHSLPYSILLVPIYNTDANADISILISSDTYYSGNIANIYLGNDMSIILMLIKKNLLWLGLVIVIFIIGLICLACYYIYRNTFEEGYALVYLFWFAMLTSIHCFSELRIRQMFTKNIVSLESLGYCCFLLLPLAIVLYTNWITKSKHRTVYVTIGILAVINFLVQNTLHTASGYDYLEMQEITQILSLVVLVICTAFCLIDIKKEKQHNLIYLIIALSGQILGIIAEAVCMGMHIDYAVDSFYIIGALIFLGTNMFYIFFSVNVEQRRKKDAESANVAKSQFLATMSHEIRTPINAVLGMNEMIMRESKEDTILEYASNISDAGKSLLSLVNDILDFSKIESGKMDIVCVEYQMKSLLCDLILMTQTRIAKKDLKLELDIDETIPAKYFGDEVRLKQVVTNILTNAAKYTESGIIKFTVKQKQIENDEIELYFSVKDSGIGIKPEDLEILRNNSSFTRVDQARNRNIEGTGLGLSITKQLLTLMDSNLEISSEYGHGSDFYFYIKQKVVDAAPMGSVMGAKGAKVKRKSNTFTAPDALILAVDDTKTNLMVIKGLLKPYGLKVDLVSSGEECIDKCKNNYYDLILMDHMMPGMDGIETFKRLREDISGACCDSKVVVLTANAISGAAKMYEDSGFDGYLTKPIDVHELDKCLKEKLPAHFIKPLVSE